MDGDHEDTWFAFTCGPQRLKIPSWEQARSFAVESVYFRPTLGLHKSWRYIKSGGGPKKRALYQLMRSYDQRAFDEAEKRWGKTGHTGHKRNDNSGSTA
jgi:hypothetical protein